jgi:hypothetical protein
MMIVVLLFRPEATTPTGIYTYNPANPFDGIEVYEILPDHADVVALNDRLQKLGQEHPGWNFMLDKRQLNERPELAISGRPKPTLPLFDSGNPNLAAEMDEMFGSVPESVNMRALRNRAADLRIVNYSLMEEAELRAAITEAERIQGVQGHSHKV